MFNVGVFSPVFNGGFHRQQLYGIVARVDFFTGGEEFSLGQLFGNLLVDVGQPLQGALGRSGFDMNLQDVGGGRHPGNLGFGHTL
jgi:hypothetical protein